MGTALYERLVKPVLEKSVWFWLVAVALLLVGVQLGGWLDHNRIWLTTRYRVHHALSATADRRDVVPRYTRVVLIDDDEYWAGEPAGRKPIRRDYLARLVLAVAEADPSVIALDFDLRSLTPNGDPESASIYESETRELIEAIRRVSGTRPVVLAKTLGWSSDGERQIDADVYDADFWYTDRRDSAKPGSVTSDANEGTKPGVRVGFISLPRDLRVVPLPLTFEDGTRLDSFSVAIARAGGSPENEVFASGVVQYGSYISERDFRKANAVVRARDVLDGDSHARDPLRHRVVIIGGQWSTLAKDRGALSDTSETPVGMLAGVFVHANYVEAILDSRLFTPVSHEAATFAEVLLIAIGVLALVAEIRPAHKAGVLLGLCGLLVAGNFFLLQNLGTFFDALIPLVLVAGHLLVHKILEWRADSRKLAASHRAAGVPAT